MGTNTTIHSNTWDKGSTAKQWWVKTLSRVTVTSTACQDRSRRMRCSAFAVSWIVRPSLHASDSHVLANAMLVRLRVYHHGAADNLHEAKNQENVGERRSLQSEAHTPAALLEAQEQRQAGLGKHQGRFRALTEYGPLSCTESVVNSSALPSVVGRLRLPEGPYDSPG